MSPLRGRSPGAWRGAGGAGADSHPRHGHCCWIHRRLGWRETLDSLPHSSEHSPFLSEFSLYTPAAGGGKKERAARFAPALKSRSCAGPGTGPPHPGTGAAALTDPRPRPGVQKKKRSPEPPWRLLSAEGCHSRHVLLRGELYCAQLKAKFSKFRTREHGGQ